MVPDVAAFADASPGYAIICSPAVQGCGPSAGQTIAFVGGTSAAAPLVAGMVALWDQQAKQSGLPNPGFVPPLLYSIAAHSPGAFLDITAGSNAVFGGVSSCAATPGFDMASGARLAPSRPNRATSASLIERFAHCGFVRILGHLQKRLLLNLGGERDQDPLRAVLWYDVFKAGPATSRPKGPVDE